MLTGDWFVSVDVGTVFNLLFCEHYVETFGLPVGIDDGEGGDEYFFATQPATSFDGEIADCPGFIVKVEIIDGAEFAVGGTDSEAVQVFYVF